MSPLHIVAIVFAVLAVCGLGYIALSLVSARNFLRTRSGTVTGFTPPISILKPLKGMDPDMYESFRSHCLQDYPASYEIIFGVNKATDEAVGAVERLRREFPHRDIQLIVCPEVNGTNRKVNNLAQLLPHAKYDFILINDSDIRVPANYLRRVSAEFSDENVGMVTALYRGVPHRTLWSTLEALTISTDFAGGVLSAMTVEGGLHFALGSTLAIRKVALQNIGGFEPLLNYLADDYELGHRTSKAGYRVALSDVVVETFLPPYSFAEMFNHQLRWSRTVRDRRKADYLGLLFTFGLPWAVIAAVLAPRAWWSVAVLIAVLLGRLASAYVLSHAVLHDEISLRKLWLVPLRDAVGVLIWISSFFGNTIVWRGEKFRLKEGKLHRR